MFCINWEQINVSMKFFQKKCEIKPVFLLSVKKIEGGEGTFLKPDILKFL